MSRVGDYIMMGGQDRINYGETVRNSIQDGARQRAAEAIARGDLDDARNSLARAGETEQVLGLTQMQNQDDINRMIVDGNEEKARAFAAQQGAGASAYHEGRVADRDAAEQTERDQALSITRELSRSIDGAAPEDRPALLQSLSRAYGVDMADLEPLLDDQYRAALQAAVQEQMTPYQQAQVENEQGRQALVRSGHQLEVREFEADEAERRRLLERDQRMLGTGQPSAAPTGEPGPAPTPAQSGFDMDAYLSSAEPARAPTVGGGTNFVSPETARGGSAPSVGSNFLDPQGGAPKMDRGQPKQPVAQTRTVTLPNGIQVETPVLREIPYPRSSDPVAGQPAAQALTDVQAARAARDARAAGEKPRDGSKQARRSPVGAVVLPPDRAGEITNWETETVTVWNPATGREEQYRARFAEYEAQDGTTYRLETPLDASGQINGFQAAQQFIEQERASGGEDLSIQLGSETRGKATFSMPMAIDGITELERIYAEAQGNPLNSARNVAAAAGETLPLVGQTINNVVGDDRRDDIARAWNQIENIISIPSGAAVTPSEAQRLRNALQPQIGLRNDQVQDRLRVTRLTIEALNAAMLGNVRVYEEVVRAVREDGSLDMDRIAQIEQEFLEGSGASETDIRSYQNARRGQTGGGSGPAPTPAQNPAPVSAQQRPIEELRAADINSLTLEEVQRLLDEGE